MGQHPTLKGFAYVFFSILIWSGWVVASRLAVKGTLSPYDITAIRFTTAGLIMAPVAFRRGLAIGPRGWLSGFALAFLVGAPYTNVAVAGMQFAPASHASTVINGSLLVLTSIVGIRVMGEPTNTTRIVGILCCGCGIICMLLAKSAGGDRQWLGHLLFMTAGLMWGGYTLLVRAWKVEALHAACVVCVMSLLMYLPPYLLFAHSHISLNNWHEVAFQCVYQGLFTGVLALISFNRGIALLGASRAGALIPLVPVISTLLAIPILGETPSFLEWAGVGAVSFGVFLASGLLRARPDWLLQREVAD